MHARERLSTEGRNELTGSFRGLSTAKCGARELMTMSFSSTSTLVNYLTIIEGRYSWSHPSDTCSAPTLPSPHHDGTFTSLKPVKEIDGATVVKPRRRYPASAPHHTSGHTDQQPAVPRHSQQPPAQPYATPPPRCSSCILFQALTLTKWHRPTLAGIHTWPSQQQPPPQPRQNRHPP